MVVLTSWCNGVFSGTVVGDRVAEDCLWSTLLLLEHGVECEM